MKGMSDSQVISRLQSMKQGLAEPSEKEDAKALDAAMDIIHDYGRMAKQVVQLQRHFQIEAKPKLECGVWLCPGCHGSVKGWHSYCGKCGKRIGWNGLIPRGKPLEKKGKKKR